METPTCISRRDTVKYLVVEYTDDNNIAVIPSNWLDHEGTQCALWPPYTDSRRLLNAAKRKEVPGRDWRSYPILLPAFFETEDWELACRKCRRLESHSNVESTDHEDRGRSKRAKRSPQRLYNDMARSPSTSPIPHVRVQKTKSKRIYTPCSSDSETEDVPRPRKTMPPKSSLPVPPNANGTISKKPTCSSGSGGKKSLHLVSVTPNRSSSPFLPLPRTSSPVCSNTSNEHTNSAFGSCNPSTVTAAGSQGNMVSLAAIEPALNQILTLLEEIKMEQKNIKRAFLGRRDDRRQTTQNVVEIPEGTFPFETMQQVDEMERNLVTKEWREQVIQHLSLIGGKNVADEVRNVMKKSLAHQLVLQFTISGKGATTRAFQDLKFFHAICDAVRKNHPAAKEQDIKTVIKKWLSGSHDRNGGRRLRQVAKAGGAPAAATNVVAANDQDGIFVDEEEEPEV